MLFLYTQNDQRKILSKENALSSTFMRHLRHLFPFPCYTSSTANNETLPDFRALVALFVGAVL